MLEGEFERFDQVLLMVETAPNELDG